MIDLDDAESDILDSMSADDRQTKAQYQRGCAALSAVLAELRTLREAQRCPKVEPLDLEMLEQCAKLIRDLSEFGMSNMRASRLRLLADWATVYEKAALPALPDAPKGEL